MVWGDGNGDVEEKRLKSYLEVRIDMTYWKQDIREKIVSSSPRFSKSKA